ncbi:MAG: hypothetical protein IKY88_01290, partial [Phascolarctobacterium sp.]|nr:hypothetical protein [Phascolarctobacterium sp.]
MAGSVVRTNIMAMNANRSLGINNGLVGKSLEKLSSGFRINRAGDDASGLAISEKMKAQIKGLETASSNSQDGISLIQTAEGALTEVHNMLNRMTELATKSANGTLQDDVDRDALQAEVDSLLEEIDRIGNSTNFNGINLLDGSLSAEGATKAGGAIALDISKLGIDVTANAMDVSAVKGKYTTSVIPEFDGTTGNQAVVADGDKISYTVNFTDADGKEQSITKTIIAKVDATAANKTTFVLDDGTEDGVKLTSVTSAGVATKPTGAELSKLFAEAFNADDTIKANFTVDGTTSGGKLILEARVGGSDGAVLNSVALSAWDKSADTTSNIATKVDVTANTPADATKAYDLAEAKIWNNGDKTSGEDNAEKDLANAIFEINGEKFVFMNEAASDEDLKALEAAGVSHWVALGTADGAILAGDVTEMVEKIKKETGLEVEQGTAAANGGAIEWTKGNGAGGNDDTMVIFKNSITPDEVVKGGLQLQIGDTSDSFNVMTVSVDDLRSEALGLSGLDISNAESASASIQTIKDAINKVSTNRANMGALQNRLEYTINNLDVAAENMSAANSRIRDTDMAKEMMNYTKMNVLTQAAQAMLAQANQQPQSVLQLLG